MRKSIIGVNHLTCLYYQYSSKCKIPSVSPEMYDFLADKKIGLELTPSENRKKLLEKFYYEGGKQKQPKMYYNLYNPFSFNYFENLEKEFPDCILLDSYDLNALMIEIDKKHIISTYKLDENLSADRKSTRLNSSHIPLSRMPSSA